MYGLTFKQRMKQYGKELAPWGIGVLIAVVSVGVARQALKRYQIQQQIHGMEQSVSDLQTKNGQLVELLSYVKSPAYTEEQARLRFGFGKPGERLAILPEGSVLGVTNSGDATNGASQPQNIKNHWKWWSYFFPESN